MQRSEFRIDGALCGGLVDWSGGGARADAIAANSAGGAPAKRHLGAMTCEPIVARFSFPLAAPLVSWLGQMSAGTAGRRAVSILDFDGSGNALGAPLEGLNALLGEVRFPALNAAGASTQYLTVVFFPESTRSATTATSSGAASAGGAGIVGFTGSFRLQITGVDMSVASQIDGLVLRQGVVAPANGEFRDYTVQPGRVEFSTLVVRVAYDPATELQAWHDEFVVKGNNGDDREKSATLELLGTNGSVLLPISFSHLGIMRLSRLPAEPGTVRRVEAEFYFEGMSFDTKMAGTSTTSTALAAGNTEPASSGTTLAPAIASVATPVAIASPVPGGPATAIEPAIGGPARNVSPTSPTTTVAPAAPATAIEPGTAVRTAPGAAGARALPPGTVAPVVAPAAASTGPEAMAFGSLPVPEGAERKSFTLILRPDTAQITANYTTTVPLVTAADRYDEQIRAAGWEETFRNESGEPARGTLAVTAGWSQGSGNAQLSFRQAEDNATAFSVMVTNGVRPGGQPYLPLVPDVASTTTASAGASGSAAADQGSRDPANFPRAPGSVRKSYGSSRSGGTTHENAIYTAPGTPAAQEAFFADRLLADGWEETFRHEINDTAGNIQITLDWQKSGRTVRFLLGAGKDETEISVTLATTRVPGG